MKKMKRVLSLILCFVMLMGYVPVNAIVYAAEKTPIDAAIIFTDLHSSKSDYKDESGEAIQNIFGALKNAGLPFSSVTSGGDAFSVNEETSNSNGPYDGYTKTISTAIRNALGNSNIPINYVWSDHDRYAYQEDGTTLLDKTSHLTYGAGSDGEYGTEDDDNYYIYSLSMGDLCTYDRYNAGFNYTLSSNNRTSKGFTATVPEAIENFKTAVASLNKDRPLFIVSHQPLFDNRNDNGWAEDWCDAINEVASDMDVAFFYGHNHKYDSGSDYYYAKGSTMPVATRSFINGSDWNYAYQTNSGWKYNNDLASVNKVLNFSHMCAGYLAPSSTGSTSGTTREGVAMAVSIYDDSICFTTYNANGIFTGSYAVNETVTREHANLGGTTEPDDSTNTPITPEDTEVTINGTTIKVSGATVNSATELTSGDQALIDAVNYADVLAFDIDAILVDEKATLEFPVPSDWQDKSDRIIGISVEEGVLNEIEGTYADGKFTFDVEHFSAKGIALAAANGDWVTITAPVGGTTVYNYILDVDGIDINGKYLIVNSNTGSAYALGKDSSNSIIDTSVSLNGTTISVTDDSTVAWTYDGKDFKIGNRSLKPENNKAPSTSTSSQSLTVVKNTDNSGAYQIYRKGYSGTYYLKWNTSNNSWTCSTGTSAEVYLYKYVGEPSITGGTNGLYAKITDDLTADFTYTLAYGADANTALNAAKAGITVYTNTTTSGTGTAIEDTVTGLEWALDSNYNGNVPGEYAVTISYQDKTIGTAKVVVPERVIKTVVLSANEGNLQQGKSTISGAVVIVTYTDNSTEQIPLDTSMITAGTYNGKVLGSYEGLTIKYHSQVLSQDFKLNVIEGNNYPEYPDEGAVKVNKTGMGIDFTYTGIARVELSASGVPLKKGADLIIMLDTSSSMEKNNISYEDGTTKSRAAVLEESLKALIAKLKTPGEDGEVLDIKVAIADFNGYYGNGVNATGAQSGTPYDRTSGDYVTSDNNGTGSGYNQPSKAQVYTGSKALNKDAFVAVEDLANSYTLNYTSGTNYDYAFDAIYQLGTAIKADNGTEARDLYVIFMSDGASLQWNYFGTQNGYDKWNNWLSGSWTSSDLTTRNLNSVAHSYFYDTYDHDNDGHINEHRMANAIKGDPDLEYEVIRKSEAGLPEGTLKTAGKEYLYKVHGLGATMFTINFDAKQDGDILVGNIDKALASTASDQTGSTKYYYKVTKADELGHAFDIIGSEIAYAATNARFVDKMGDDYNLQMKTYHYSVNGENKTITPKIEIISYDIYTNADYEAGTIPEGKNIGDRTGTYKILETVTFSANGQEAYSDLIDGGKTNILADGKTEGFVSGVIYAKTFIYNTNISPVSISGVSIPNDKNNLADTTTSLPEETFYWKMGTVQTKELAMRYYVYLDGSMEDPGIPAGSYPTNKYATLYYDNYLGNPCYKDTVSPILPWGAANVSYAFYLVDTNGNIIVNQATGQTGTFANKVVVQGPKVFQQINLNADGTALNLAIDKTLSSKLPNNYVLYDSDATYSVEVRSDNTGSWTIGKSNNKVASTYVTNYRTDDPSTYTNATPFSETKNVTYMHTVVWFAVVVNKANPDTIVMDYGKGIKIDALENDSDIEGFAREIKGILPVTGDFDLTTALTNGLPNKYKSAYGEFTIVAGTDKDNEVLYTPKAMLDVVDKVIYVVEYTEITTDSNPSVFYLYSTISVIPATTMLYETDFATGVFTTTTTGTAWTIVNDGTNSTDKFQDDGTIGRNQTYGYDSSYENDALLSNGTSYFVEGMGYDPKNNNAPYTYTTFSFKGTGFEVISRTGELQGLIKVEVFKDAAMTDSEKTISVLNKSESKFELYQIPVVSINTLDYGTHYVRISVAAEYTNTKIEALKRGGQFHFDAVRIFDPAAGNPEAEAAYTQDNEASRNLTEIRHLLISQNTFVALNGSKAGAVLIDRTQNNVAEVGDYAQIGPNNETYLSKGQAVAFKLTTGAVPNSLDIGAKSITGAPAGLSVVLTDGNTANATKIVTTKTITSSTAQNIHVLGTDADKVKVDELFTDKEVYVVITNTGEGVLSVTDIKAAYGSAAAAVSEGDEDPYWVSYSADLTTFAVACQVLKTPHKPITPVNPVQPDNTVEEDVQVEIENPGKTEGEAGEEDNSEENSVTIRVPVRIENKRRRP